MAELVVGTSPFDMATWNLSRLEHGAVTLTSATEVDVTDSSGHILYKIFGAGFTTSSSHGLPTSGTITGLSQGNSGATAPMEITGLSLSAHEFTLDLHRHDYAALESTMFQGDDMFVSRHNNDTLIGFGGDDTFNLSQGGNDTAQGNDGDDAVHFGAAFTAADSVDGGADTDEVFLRGDYSAGVTFGAATMVNVETLHLGKGFDYNLTLNATSDTAGQALTINAFTLRASNHVTLDVSQLTGTVAVLGGRGDDVVNFGGNFDSHDRIDGGAGNDIMVLDGDYATHTRIFASQIQDVETLQLAAGHSYNIKLGAPVPVVDASALGAGDTFTFKLGPQYQAIKIIAGAGNDTINTEAGSALATIDLSRGGDDIVYVNAAEDGGQPSGTLLNYGAAYTSADQIFSINDDHFNPGIVTVGLDGDYSAGLSFDSTALSEIDQLNLAGGHSYNLTVDGTLSHEIRILTTLTTGDNLTFDGSAQTGGTILIAQSAGSFHITGGGGSSGVNFLLFDGTASGSFTGGTAQTTVEWGAGFNSSDSIEGGAGGQSNMFTLFGDYSGGLTFTAAMMQNFQQLALTAAHDKITLADGNIAASHTLLVSGKFLTLDDRAETDGRISVNIDGGTVNAGAGNDTVYGGKHSDTISGGGGGDTVYCGTGTDTLVYNAVSDSTGSRYDVVQSFNANVDFFNMPGAVTGIDVKVASGTLSTATFDADLAASVGSGQLAAHHAVLFTPNAGTLSGDTFLIVDDNGTAGYQAGADYVIQLITPTNLSALSTADFS